MTDASPPPGRPAGPSHRPSPEGQRYILQGVLGEYHGLLTTVLNELLPPSAKTPWYSNAEMLEMFEYLREAYPRVSVAFGEVQGALNTGKHDERLDRVGLARDQLGPKRKGLHYNLRRFYGGLRRASTKAGFIRAAKHGLRAVKWGNIIVGSLSKELRKVRGIELILEFGQAVAETLEHVIDVQEAAAAEKKQ